MLQVVDGPPPVELLLDEYPDAIRATGLSLRALIFRTVAGTVESIRPGWRWIAYSLPEGRRVRTFAWIGPERKHIHLGFEHGTLLEDPDRILHGAEERLKRFRYLTFEPSIDIDEGVLGGYLSQAADLATMPSDARRALVLQRELGFAYPASIPRDREPIAGAEPRNGG